MKFHDYAEALEVYQDRIARPGLLLGASVDQEITDKQYDQLRAIVREQFERLDNVTLHSQNAGIRRNRSKPQA